MGETGELETMINGQNNESEEIRTVGKHEKTKTCSNVCLKRAKNSMSLINEYAQIGILRRCMDRFTDTVQDETLRICPYTFIYTC